MKTFEEYLKQDIPEMRRALTDDTYKTVWQREKRSARTLADKEVNSELATLGDAVLKLAIAEMLLDRVENITVVKQRYESDRVLVTVVGRHYDLLRYLRCDPAVAKQDYDYTGDGHKHIATALEAALGAIYLTDGFAAAREVVKAWCHLIDRQMGGANA